MSVRSIPHHRVDAALYQQARTAADERGLTMSAVAVAGLQRFIADRSVQSSTVGLPVALSRELKELFVSGSPDLDRRIAELYSAGWSYAAIAVPLNVTRQAVHMRARKSGLAPVRTGRREIFDWAIWVSPDLYRQARQSAAAHGLNMRAIMEQVLKSFVDGTLEVANADDKTITHDNQERTA